MNIFRSFFLYFVISRFNYYIYIKIIWLLIEICNKHDYYKSAKSLFQNDVVGRMCYEGTQILQDCLSLLWVIQTSVDNSQYPSDLFTRRN